MPNFEKSQPRKFSPIHYEPRTVRPERGDSRSSGAGETDIFLQKQDRGIRYKDWASTPIKDNGKGYNIHVRSGFWATLWETILFRFRKPVPLIGGDEEKERKSKNTKELHKKHQRGDRRKEGADNGGSRPKDQGRRQHPQQQQQQQSNKERAEGGSEGGNRKRSRRKRRPGGQEAGKSGVNPQHSERPVHQQQRTVQQGEARPQSDRNGHAPQAQGNNRGPVQDGEQKPNRNRRNRNRNRGNRSPGNQQPSRGEE
jgi:hypothetical protein